MLGTIVNAGAIVLGALLGNLLKGGFPENYKSVIMQGVSLTVILIGLSMALKTESILVLTLSIVTGGILGEALRLEERLNSLGRKLEQRFAGGGGSSQGSVIVKGGGNVESGLVESGRESGLPYQAVGKECGVNIENGCESGLPRQAVESKCGSNAVNGLEGALDVGCVYKEDGHQACAYEGRSQIEDAHQACAYESCAYEGHNQSEDGHGNSFASAGDASQNAESSPLESEDSGKGGLFIKGFVTGSLVFCVGAMAIMGALESGLTGRHTTLFIKSILDGVTATVFASTMGIGVAFSALPVFLYQGAITLAAVYVKPFLTDAMITEMTAVGGLLIFGIGLNLLTDKLHIKVGNLLPAIFAAIFFVIVLGRFSL
ncbi:MAG: DUF554 domain-containing protein [Thermacetogeniaceae bacterium]